MSNVQIWRRELDLAIAIDIACVAKVSFLKRKEKSVKEISEIVKYGTLSIYDWIKRFEESGVEGLREKGGRGAKPLMCTNDEESVKEAVCEYRESLRLLKLLGILLPMFYMKGME